MNALVTYFRESLEELHKVRWPTRRQAVRLSAITVVFVITTSLFFGLVDVLLSQSVTAFLNTLF
jgi:preprotein translocase SecE subunit